MPVQTRQSRALMRQSQLHDLWSCSIQCTLAERLSQAAQTSPDWQRQACSIARHSRSCPATPSDEHLLAELDTFDHQCLQAYIASARSTDDAPQFEDEAEFSLFQQEAAARRKLDAARREAEVLFEADAEQDSLLQAAAQNALAEQQACCQQLHTAADLMAKPHKLRGMTIEDLSSLQAAAQHFLSICSDVRDQLHEQEVVRVRQENCKMAEALRAAEVLAADRSDLFV